MLDANDRLVRAARELLRWDQEQLADRAGVGLATVRRYERGKRVTAENAGKISAALRAAGVAFIDPSSSRELVEGVALTRHARPFDAPAERKYAPRKEKDARAESRSGGDGASSRSTPNAGRPKRPRPGPAREAPRG